jgi:hypothetical protein
MNAWIIMRDVRVTALYWTLLLMDLPGVEEYFRSHGRFIKSINFDEISISWEIIDKQILWSLLRHCANVIHLAAASFNTILQTTVRCPMLEEITFTGRFRSDDVFSLEGQCPMLRKLEITANCKSFQHYGNDLLVNRPLLTDLVLSTEVHLRESFLVQGARGCPNLSTVSLRKADMSDTVLDALAEHCVHLRCLHLRDGVLNTAYGVPLLPHRCLTTLTLHNMSMRDHDVTGVLRSCTALQHLIIFGSVNFRETANTFGCIGPLAPNLQTLKIRAFRNVDAAFLVGLGTHCSQLRELRACITFQICDADLLLLARGCSLLETVELSECSLITEAGLAAFLMHCARLRFLNMKSCKLISNKAVKALREKSGHFVEFEISKRP